MEEKHKEEMKKMREEMSQQFKQIMYIVKQNPNLSNVKPEVLMGKKIQCQILDIGIIFNCFQVNQ